MVKDLRTISDQDMNRMLELYSIKFNHSGSIGVSTRKDGLISVYSNKGKMLFNDNFEEVTRKAGESPGL